MFYVTVGIPVAALADRANRRNILAVSLAAWSAMTALCGLAHNHTAATARAFLASASARPAARRPPPRSSRTFSSGAPAHGADHLRSRSLSRRLARLFSRGHGCRAWRLARRISGARPSGCGAGDSSCGSRCGAAPWPARCRLPARAAGRSTLYRRRCASSPGNARRCTCSLGGSVATFWSWGLMWWTPTFLQRSHHLSVGQAGQLLGPMHLIAGTASTLLAGWLMAQRAAADPRYVTRLLGWVTALTTIPSLLLYWVVSERAAVVLLWIFVPAVYFYIGPILGLLQNVVPAHMRATACAILLFLANVRQSAARSSAHRLAERLVRGVLRCGCGVIALGIAAARAHRVLGGVAPVDERRHDPRGRGARDLMRVTRACLPRCGCHPWHRCRLSSVHRLADHRGHAALDARRGIGRDGEVPRGC